MGKLINKTNKWNSEAFELLQPLHRHLNELIEAIEQHNQLAKKLGNPLIAKSKVAKAKAANEAANNFSSFGFRNISASQLIAKSGHTSLTAGRPFNRNAYKNN